MLIMLSVCIPLESFFLGIASNLLNEAMIFRSIELYIAGVSFPALNLHI